MHLYCYTTPIVCYRGLNRKDWLQRSSNCSNDIHTVPTGPRWWSSSRWFLVNLSDWYISLLVSDFTFKSDPIWTHHPDHRSSSNFLHHKPIFSPFPKPSIPHHQPIVASDPNWWKYHHQGVIHLGYVVFLLCRLGIRDRCPGRGGVFLRQMLILGPWIGGGNRGALPRIGAIQGLLFLHVSILLCGLMAQWVRSSIIELLWLTMDDRTEENDPWDDPK